MRTGVSALRRASAPACIAIASIGARAEVTLPAAFSDHMVLQADAAVAVWGWAAPGEEVTVAFAGQSKTAKTAGDGKWMLKLDSMRASAEPREMIVASANQKSAIRNLKLADVLVGEVWLASGQSNMEMQIKGKQHGSVDRADEEIAAGPFTGLYGTQLRTLIADWRSRWGSEFYFAWVQLPGFGKGQSLPSEPNGWGVAVRDEMRKTLSVPRTGMAVTMDIGDPTQGHPTNKAAFAARLSPLALHDVYGKAIRDCSGPLFRSAQRDGGRMVLAFDHAGGLKATAGGLKGFAIAGDDRKFVWAEAKVEGDKVIVRSDAVREPAAVRYAWAANPKCNLVNAAGLPASPFRTDDWK